MQSMEEIYQEHAQMVYRYLLGLTMDEHLAEELTQETFYQALRSVNRFDGSCKVTTWLCGIAKNVLRSHRRKNPPREELADHCAVTPGMEADAIARESSMELLRRIHSFREDTREVMYLRLFGNLSFRQIGQVLGKTENWARVTYYRGKERLKKEMESNGEQTEL